MEFWPEFLAGTSGREFIAGGVGGIAGVIAGHPLDTLRIRLQQPRTNPSVAPIKATALLRQIVAKEGALALFKGMSSPVATIAFQVTLLPSLPRKPQSLESQKLSRAGSALNP